MKVARPILTLALVAAVGSGCDTLRARSLANDGVALYKKGDLKGAIDNFEKAKTFDPSIPAIHLNLGFTYLSLFSSSPKSKEGYEAGGKAITEFKDYIQLKPSDPRGRQYIVQTFVDTNRYTDAVEYFKPEVDANPPSLEAVQTLGLIASKTGRLDDALSWYQRRCDLSPNDPEAHLNLGILVWEHLHNHAEVTGDERVKLADRAIVSLSKAAELKPHDSIAVTYLNLVHRERAKAFVPALPPPVQLALAADPCGRVPDLDPTQVPTDPAAKQAMDDANAKRTADCTEANKFMQQAMDLNKAQNGGGTKPAGTK